LFLVVWFLTRRYAALLPNKTVFPRSGKETPLFDETLRVEEFGVSRFVSFFLLSGIKAGELSLHTFFPSTERKYEVFISYLPATGVSFLP
jgi:hypothetical protein